MTELEHDPLIARLRQADPASPVIPLPNREALKRRRRSRQAARVAIGAAAVAGAVTLAVSLGPSSGPTADDVLARAAAATAPPEGKIVEIVSRRDAGGTGHDGRWSLWQEETTWVRYSATGKVLSVRSLFTAASGGQSGYEEVYENRNGNHVSRRFDPKTGDVKTDSSWPTPSITFDSHRLLAAARAGDKGAVLDGEETIDGRRAYRIVVTGWGERPVSKEIDERRELLVDTETYQPIVERVVESGKTVNTESEGIPNGSPFTYRLTHRVARYRELPDTSENRRLLELHGGEAQK